jgi:uncharacterized membrane protein
VVDDKGVLRAARRAKAWAAGQARPQGVGQVLQSARRQAGIGVQVVTDLISHDAHVEQDQQSLRGSRIKVAVLTVLVAAQYEMT